MKTIKLCLLLCCLSCLVGCGQVEIPNPLNGDRFSLNAVNSNLAETATPKIITELNQKLEQYSPQVKILTPRPNQILSQTNINIHLEVEDLPVFQDDKLKLGNHLDLILDNQPVQPIYDVTQPVTLTNLSPGTHTLRVFADRPWGESYKNEGAYAQTTFSVLTETNDNHPDSNLPLLTYSNPTGTYGAEPVLLDFYLTNAPLHSVAKNDSNLSDWKIKTTINGDSFFLENWQPVYLTGLNKGENWIQLELIDEAGNNIENTYNNTVRVINYDPQQQDTLSQLVTSKITLAEAQPLIEQNYYIQPVGTPEIIEPTVKANEPELTKSLDKQEIESTKEPAVTDKIDAKLIEEKLTTETSKPTQPTEPENNLNSLRELDIPVQRTTEPPAISTPEIAESKETIKATKNSFAEEISEVEAREEVEIVEPAKTERTITITQENDIPEPIAAIKIPEPESIDITEDAIDITIPQIEPDSSLKTQTVPWWKRILVRLRQKLEGLVKLLPREV